MRNDLIIFGPEVRVSPKAYAYMTSLNILHILSAFARSLQWITPPKSHLDITYFESSAKAHFSVSVNYIDLHIEALAKPSVRDIALATVFRVDRSSDCWVVRLPTETQDRELSDLSRAIDSCIHLSEEAFMVEIETESFEVTALFDKIYRAGLIPHQHKEVTYSYTPMSTSDFFEIKATERLVIRVETPNQSLSTKPVQFKASLIDGIWHITA